MDDKTKKYLEDILWAIVINHIPKLKAEVVELLG